jgi:hypothetical protein
MFGWLARFIKGDSVKRRAAKLRAEQQKKADELKAQEAAQLARKKYTFSHRYLDIERYTGPERQKRINWWSKVAKRRLKRLIAMNTNRRVRGLFEYKIEA